MTASIIRNDSSNYTRSRYNKWYDEDHYYYLDSEAAQILYRSVAGIFCQQDCKSLLDVGCHHGSLVPHLKKDSLEKYVGIDISDRAIEEALRKYQDNKKVHFFREEWSDFEKIKHHGKFDCIYFGGVFFYIPDPKIGFLRSFLSLTGTKIFVVQDLANTDLSSIMNEFTCLSEKYFYLDFDFPKKSWGPDWREKFGWNEDWDSNILKERQLLTFSANHKVL